MSLCQPRANKQPTPSISTARNWKSLRGSARALKISVTCSGKRLEGERAGVLRQGPGRIAARELRKGSDCELRKGARAIASRGAESNKKVRGKACSAQLVDRNSTWRIFHNALKMLALGREVSACSRLPACSTPLTVSSAGCSECLLSHPLDRSVASGRRNQRCGTERGLLSCHLVRAANCHERNVNSIL